MVKVVIGCEVCGKKCAIGNEEIATYNHKGEEFCIQSEDGGFVCKECWDKFMKFCSKVVLCGSDPLDEPDLDDIETALDKSEEEAIIDSVILEAAIKDGAAHYSTDDGHRFIITHIGMGKRYPTEKPDTGISFHGGVTFAEISKESLGVDYWCHNCDKSALTRMQDGTCRCGNCGFETTDPPEKEVE